MRELTFDDKTITTVKLNGKVVGKIKEVKGGWQYSPKDSPKNKGEVYQSKFACMQSLYK